MKNECLICSVNLIETFGHVLIGTENGRIKIWDYFTGEFLKTIVLNYSDPLVEILIIDSVQNYQIICCSINQSFVNLVDPFNDCVKNIDLKNKFFIEFGCGVSPKLQFLNEKGKISIFAVDQRDNSKEISIWNIENFF